MNAVELIEHKEQIISDKSFVDIFDVKTDLEDNVVLNNKIPIKIDAVSSVYNEGAEIEILNEMGEVLGVLYIANHDGIIPIENLTENRYIAYLRDVSSEDFQTNTFRISNSYAIIKEERFEEYSRLIETSPIWGNFLHKSPQNYSLQGKSKPINQITAFGSIKFPTEIHRLNSVNTILEPFTFERFLKKYHHIELLSDLLIVEKIKNLGDDLYGIGSLLSDINSQELHRIRMILNNRVVRLESIADKLFLVTGFKDKAEIIFQKYSKSGNPFSDTTEFNKFLGLPDFREATLINSFRKNVKAEKYKSFIIDLASYWIYRIRCSIAHKRIGEYVITTGDEDFLIEFGEPLIDCLVLEVLKS